MEGADHPLSAPGRLPVEELRWRGFALEPLKERYGPGRGSLILGGVWTVWHLPLFFVPGLVRLRRLLVGTDHDPSDTSLRAF